ncbi:hypothetical protein [Mycobacterium simiae]|uniref:hypothetical protein n=1 Tax=Mycobacterium simiae TaxID=1784 RepID=UPI00261D6880|nr:hypothetical protein [Mycobacterium simiae]
MFTLLHMWRIDRLREKLDSAVHEWMEADPDMVLIAQGRAQGLAQALAIMLGSDESTEFNSAQDRYIQMQHRVCGT